MNVVALGQMLHLSLSPLSCFLHCLCYKTFCTWCCCLQMYRSAHPSSRRMNSKLQRAVKSIVRQLFLFSLAKQSLREPECF